MTPEEVTDGIDNSLFLERMNNYLEEIRNGINLIKTIMIIYFVLFLIGIAATIAAAGG